MRSGSARARACKRGDTIAIVGANRPRLYWSVTAAQTLGAVPVPVYADAVADELAYVLAHAEVRFAAVRGPGAGRQDPVGRRSGCRSSSTIVYDEPRGLARLRPQPACTPIDDVIARRPRGAGARCRSSAQWLDREIAAGKGADTSIILYTSGTTGQPKGVVLSAERLHRRRRATRSPSTS